MKSTQISSMFMFMTETEEASLCGGSTAVAVSNETGTITKVKASLAKAAVKKQPAKKAFKSTSTTKVVKNIKGGAIPPEVLSPDFLSIFGLS
ncbi:hypothetical protein [Nostoc sp.]|uniref:hypothetical protein n=1 Tax=Nostoc sp. TaxID=1180 RepID=UPI002FF895B8